MVPTNPSEPAAILAGTPWETAALFNDALSNLPRQKRHGAALRILRLCPKTDEAAAALTEQPHGNAARWIVNQCQLRGKAIPLEDAKSAAKKVATADLPDLIDAALAAVQSPQYPAIGGLRAGVLHMASKSREQRRDVARRWREGGNTTRGSHGPWVPLRWNR